MERIRLSKIEKKMFRGLARYGDDYLNEANRDEVRTALHSLHSKGLVYCAFVEGGDVEDARLTNLGRDYLADNPKLCNPVNWILIWSAVGAIGAIIAAIAAILALFVACSLMK